MSLEGITLNIKVPRRTTVTSYPAIPISPGIQEVIPFLNVHAPTEDKIDDIKDSFYEKLECVFNK
jgi:hypothetical protein